MSKRDIPGDTLAADAALAVEDTPERRAEQLAHLGGELDDIDEFDAAGLDDGSVLPDDYDELNPAPAASLDDGDTDDKDDSGDDATPADDTTDDDDGSDAEAVDDEAEDSDADSDSADADKADASDEAPAPKGIPKHRFDEVNERRKTAEAENDQLRAQIAAGKPPEDEAEAFDFDAAEKEYLDLTLDGDVDEALAKRKEIRAAERAEWTEVTKAETRSDIDLDMENQELLGMSAEAEQMFDVFNPNHEDYNQGMLNKVLTFMRGYETEMSRADAFVAGIADVVELYDLMPEEASDEADAPGKPAPKTKTAKKKAELAAKAHIPVAGEGAGSAAAGAVVPNIEDMSDDELDALPEKTLARMRGDIL